MKTLSGPRVIFPEGFDERAAFETPLKGWLKAQVELQDGCRYAVYFSDSIRLQQDLDTAPLAMECSKRANGDALDLQRAGRRLTLTIVSLRAALGVCSVLWAHLLFACPEKSRLSLPGF